jgi:hypothetical protein
MLFGTARGHLLPIFCVIDWHSASSPTDSRFAIPLRMSPPNTTDCCHFHGLVQAQPDWSFVKSMARMLRPLDCALLPRSRPNSHEDGLRTGNLTAASDPILSLKFNKTANGGML